jgi:hypothetical protein
MHRITFVTNLYKNHTFIDTSLTNIKNEAINIRDIIEHPFINTINNNKDIANNMDKIADNVNNINKLVSNTNNDDNKKLIY